MGFGFVCAQDGGAPSAPRQRATGPLVAGRLSLRWQLTRPVSRAVCLGPAVYLLTYLLRRSTPLRSDSRRADSGLVTTVCVQRRVGYEGRRATELGDTLHQALPW